MKIQLAESERAIIKWLLSVADAGMNLHMWSEVDRIREAIWEIYDSKTVK